MDTFARWSLVVTGIGLAINFAAVAALIVQLRLLSGQIALTRIANRDDHSRRRKQATLEFYAGADHMHQRLPRSRDAEGVARVIAEAQAGDEELGRIIGSWLDMHENIATGVRHDVYDMDVVAMQMGGRIIALAKNYRPWIEERRRLGGKSIYSEIEWLADELIALRST